jgi:hypothetical protein
MFLVSDSVLERRNKIITFLNSGEIAIAVLLAAANFEWTLRRSIISLGKSKTSNFNQKNGVFGGCHGLKDYKRVWKAEVSPNVDKILADVVPNWQYFKEEAFPLRHKLIHGVGGPPGVDYGRARVMAIIDASEALVEFTSSKEVNIFQRIKVRRKVRSSLT